MRPTDQVLGNREERSLTLRPVQTLQIGNPAIRIAAGFLLLTQGQQDSYLPLLFNLLVKGGKLDLNRSISKQCPAKRWPRKSGSTRRWVIDSAVPESLPILGHAVNGRPPAYRSHRRLSGGFRHSG